MYVHTISNYRKFPPGVATLRLIKRCKTNNLRSFYVQTYIIYDEYKYFFRHFSSEYQRNLSAFQALSQPLIC